ncbi:MAG: FMN-binding protein [Peptococcaceae bacterium]|nr:FMN-binding protein [Peptococcaceae bacterium]
MRDILKLSLILAIICAVAGAALAATYSVTSEVIVARQKAELEARLQELLPMADAFTEVDADGVVHYLAKRGGQLVGAIMVASGRGHVGPIELLVSFDVSGKVLGVKVTGHRETAGIGHKVEDQGFLRQFVGKEQGDAVAIGQDIVAVSGATTSARGVAGGVRQAIANFNVHVMRAPPEPVLDISAVADGEYEGEGEGLLGPIKVRMTVRGGKIVNIAVLSHSETPDYAARAIPEISRAVIEKQTVDVDVVSGATGASEGLIAALKQALKEAPLK